MSKCKEPAAVSAWPQPCGAPDEPRCARCARDLAARAGKFGVVVPATNQAGEPADVRSRPLHEDCADRLRDYYRAHGWDARTEELEE